MSDKRKSTLSVDEDDIIKCYKKIERNNGENAMFSKQLNDFINKKMRSDEVIKIGTTPFCLRIVDAKPIPLVINQSELTNSIEGGKRNGKKHTEQHDIPIEVLHGLPNAIRNPIIICKGKQKGSLVVVTELKDKKEDNIIVPIILNTKGKNTHVNRIASLYGKKNIQHFLNDLVNSNAILAINKEKADQLFLDTGCQLPQSTTIICFDNSIAYSMQNVKTLGELSKNKSVNRNVSSESIEKKASVIGEISSIQSKQKQERDNSPKQKTPKKKKTQHL